MKSSMSYHHFLMEKLNLLRSEDPDQIVDDFNITTDELLEIFKKRINKQLSEEYYGEQEDDTDDTASE